MLGKSFILALNPVSYRWRVGGQRVIQPCIEETPPITEPIPGHRRHWGLLAQEVKAAVDAAGVDFGGWTLDDPNNSESRQGLRYDQFIAPLIKALQEAFSEIAALQVEVSRLQRAADDRT
ncbi:MAG: tail fiber domain-containing protein [Sphingobacterium sp.]|nr:tail fiber domain-containing protein [Sphingobacterium sp.]